MTEPRFKHDCTACVFIGQHADHDIYRCPQEIIPGQPSPTIVARWDDMGSAYTSGPIVTLGNLTYSVTPTSWTVTPSPLHMPRRVVSTSPAVIREMDATQRVRFYRKNVCPFCEANCWELGPRGGISQNICCLHCLAELNVDAYGLAGQILRGPQIDVENDDGG